MSTKMSEDDLTNAVTVFRACLPRSGAKGRDDPLFLKALHYFTVHNIIWAGPCRKASASGTACGSVSTG